jgi:hypothetical protein
MNRHNNVRIMTHDPFDDWPDTEWNAELILVLVE